MFNFLLALIWLILLLTKLYFSHSFGLLPVRYNVLAEEIFGLYYAVIANSFIASIKDASLIALLFILHNLALKLKPERLKKSSLFIFTNLYILIFYYFIFEIVVFYKTGNRITTVVLENININYIISMINFNYILLIVFLIFFWFYILSYSKRIYSRITSTRLFFIYIIFISGAILNIYNYKIINPMKTSTYKNDFIKKLNFLSASSLKEIYSEINNIGKTKINEYIDYNESEKFFLTAANLIEKKRKFSKTADYENIIIVIIESLGNYCLNYYNNSIPFEASPFLNNAIKTFPHLNNFYGCGAATDYGLYSLFMSRLDFNFSSSFNNKYKPDTLFTCFEKIGFNTYYIEGSSKYISYHYLTYPQTFKVTHCFFKQELELNYSSEELKKYKRSGFGYGDKIVYNQALDILLNNKKSKNLICIKTIDTHVPFFYDKEIIFPENIKNMDDFYKSFYSMDYNLKLFIEKLKTNDLYNSKTLIIVTADHSPSFNEYYIGVDKPDYGTPDKIPLIFITANTRPFHNIDQNIISSQIDLLPSLTAMYGITIPEYFLGNNIMECISPYAINTYPGKYINFLMSENEIISIDYNNSGYSHDEKAVLKWINNFNTDKMYQSHQ